MVRCTQFINIIERDNIVELVNQVGEHVVAGLRQIAKSTGAFTSVRGKGSLIAFTLPSPRTSSSNAQCIYGCGRYRLAVRYAICAV